MKEFWTTIQVIFTGVGGWLGYFLGGCDGLLYALVLFVVVDYITGVMCAAADHKLSSEVGFKGICRKVLIFLLVGIGHVLDAQIIGTGSVLRTAVIFFYLSNEGVSLLENAGHLGLPIPEKLIRNSPRTTREQGRIVLTASLHTVLWASVRRRVLVTGLQNPAQRHPVITVSTGMAVWACMSRRKTAAGAAPVVRMISGRSRLNVPLILRCLTLSGMWSIRS